MHKPKIGVIGLKGLPAFGGAARSMENVILRLKDKYDFTIYAIETHVPDDVSEYEYNQIVFKSRKNNKLNILLYYWKSLFHSLFLSNYDAIHLNHLESGFITPFLKLKYRVILTAHGIFKYYDDKFNKLDNLFFKISEKINLVFSDIIISVSKPNVEYCKSKTRKKVVFIPNGVNLEEAFSNQIEIKDFILFSAARLYSIKGCHILIEALKKINYKGKVVIIGDLHQVPNYGKYIKKISTSLNVEFVDLIKQKEQLMEYIVKAKIFIFPSLYEAMSNTLLEVISMKTPIICSDIEANTAILSEEETIFFKSNDSDDLARKIVHALKSETRLKQLAENAYKKIVENYTWDKISNQYDVIYSGFIFDRDK
ncbi:MAG: glycosyltransferase family 4 protein [Candidatus Hodarchaeota archaeon]